MPLSRPLAPTAARELDFRPRWGWARDRRPQRSLVAPMRTGAGPPATIWFAASAVVAAGSARADQQALSIVVRDVHCAVADDVAEDRRLGAADAQPFVADPGQVLAIDHAVVVEVARQNVELAVEDGNTRVDDDDRDQVGRVDRLGQGDRVARSRAGDRDRPVVDADGAADQ